MKVAIIQPGLQAGARSANVARLIESITHAAESPEAPDLLLLPCGASLDVHSTDEATPTRAMCEGLAETIAWKAREWGVWIAAGHLWPCPERILTVATLFDADGDPFLRWPAKRAATHRGTVWSGGGAWAVRRTPLGVIALHAGDARAFEESSLPARGEPVDLAVAADVRMGDQEIEACRALARSRKCHVVVVRSALCPTLKAEDQVTLLVDRDGQVQVESRPGKNPLVFVELLVATPTKSQRQSTEDN